MIYYIFVIFGFPCHFMCLQSWFFKLLQSRLRVLTGLALNPID